VITPDSPFRGVMAATLSLIAAVSTAGAQNTGLGAIRGTVYEADFHTPLAFVRVSVVGTTLSVITSEEGSFRLDGVPPGQHTVTLALSGYQRQVVGGVLVVAGQMSDLGEIRLVSEIQDMPELVVTGTDLLAGTEITVLDIRAQDITVQDAVSKELISQSGVSDAAGAARLVTGVSVVDGKYATVRGMSDRYTGTTLNGIRVPSPDPRKRAVQIDVFPAATIEDITVTKTFTPDLQGDFTGGGVNINTRSIPDTSFFSFAFGVEYNTTATYSSNFLTYDGGGVPSTGFAGSERDLPAEAKELLPKQLSAIEFSENPSQADLEAAAAYDRLTQAFVPVMGTTTSEPDLNGNFGIAGGDVFHVGAEGILGVMGALTYTHTYDYYADGVNNVVLKSDAEQPMFIATPRADNRGTEELLIGVLGNFVYQPDPDNEYSLKLILNQAAQDEARLQVQDRGFPSAEHNQTLQYTERTLGAAQLEGEHEFRDLWNLTGPDGPGFTVDWGVAYNQTRQDEPDVRFFRNTVDLLTGNAAKPSNSTDALNTRRIYRNIGEDNVQLLGNAVLPYRQWEGLESTAKFGLALDRTDREFTQESLTYSFANQFGSRRDPAKQCNQTYGSFLAPNPDALWTDMFNDDERTGLSSDPVYCDWFPEFGISDPQPLPAPNQLLWVLEPLGDDVDYSGDQTIDALYGMIDMPLTETLSITAGARYETTQIDVVPVGELGEVDTVITTPEGNRIVVVIPDDLARTDIDDSDVLPALALLWHPKTDMNVRAVWSKTLARPTFRELAPVATEEFIDGDEFLGNPDLELSRITNYDLRWEWFRRPGEVFAASVFYKDIQDPIEYISFSLFGTRTVVQPINFETGRLSGYELEARSSLDVIAESLSGLTVGGNYTRLASEVDVPLQEQLALEPFGLDEKTRQLQGQPADLLNLFVTYDHARWGTAVGTFYNRTGEILYAGAAAGDNGSPSVYEEPVSFLNVTVSQRLKEYQRGALSLLFKAKNVLTPEIDRVYRTPDGEELLKTRRETPAIFALGAQWSW
jgi:TonB-dependent receptor